MRGRRLAPVLGVTALLGWSLASWVGLPGDGGDQGNANAPWGLGATGVPGEAPAEGSAADSGTSSLPGAEAVFGPARIGTGARGAAEDGTDSSARVVASLDERPDRLVSTPVLSMNFVAIGPPETEPPSAEPVSSGEAERIARRYFRQFVAVEELESSLRLVTDLGATEAGHTPDARVTEAREALTRAIAERDRLSMEISAIQSPAANESLPAVDLDARGEDFERLYRNYTREDLLVEQWRLMRFGYAESHRLLEELLADPRTPGEPVPASRAFA